MKHNPNALYNLKVTNDVKTYNPTTKAIERGGKCAGYYWEPVSTNADECKRVE